ncbi:MAG: hypothetical protein ACYTAQ_10020 [Planctomycetota bacterium]|jgi:hypothetical protein
MASWNVAGGEAGLVRGGVRDRAADRDALRLCPAELDSEKRALPGVAGGPADVIRHVPRAAQAHAVEQDLPGLQAFQLEHLEAGTHRRRIEPGVEQVILRRAV